MPGLTVIWGRAFLGHAPRSDHPENPKRAEAALEALRRRGLVGEVVEPLVADEEDLLEIHDRDYVELVRLLSNAAPSHIDEDTYVSSDTYFVAAAAFGSSALAAELSLKRGEPVIALVRPPGHHAGRRGRAMGAPSQGFCVFNNAAAACARLLEHGDVAVIDFDAHHGNGTQEIFHRDPRVLHVDLHQHPDTLYPGTGYPHEVGEGEARGTKVNVPLPPDSGDDVYEKAIEEIVKPVIEQFEPASLVFSAGFDAHLGDGLASLRATSSTFRALGELAARGRWRAVVAVLEGGYSIGLELGLPAFAAGLLGLDEIYSRPTHTWGRAREEAERCLDEVKRVLSRYWALRS